jgi:hypothetical protein
MIDKNLPRNSPITLTILVGLGALLLTVLIGLLVLAGGLLKALMNAPPGKPSMEAIPCCDLLLAVLAALVVIAVLLLLLLLRCCGGGGKDLPKEVRKVLALLPQLTQIPAAVRKTSVALEHTSAALGAIHERLKAAGTLLGALDSAFALQPGIDELPVPSITTNDIDVPNANLQGTQTIRVISGLDTNNKVKFNSVKGALVGARTPLQDPSVTLGVAASNIDQVRSDLHDAATVLGAIATALGA